MQNIVFPFFTSCKKRRRGGGSCISRIQASKIFPTQQSCRE